MLCELVTQAFASTVVLPVATRLGVDGVSARLATRVQGDTAIIPSFNLIAFAALSLGRHGPGSLRCDTLNFFRVGAHRDEILAAPPAIPVAICSADVVMFSFR